MSDPVLPTAVPETAPAPRTAGWVKLLLVESLGLNLAILGLAAGAALRDGGHPMRGDRGFGFGPLVEALDREDRKAVRTAFFKTFPELKQDRAALRGEFDALIALLRAPEVDPEALDAALSRIAQRSAGMLDHGRDIIGARLKSLDPASRAAFADRLEKAVDRAARHARNHEEE